MILLFLAVIFSPSQPITSLVDLVSCHHNSSLLSFPCLSLLLLVWVLGTFPPFVTSSGHKATIPPQPHLPNMLRKIQPCGFPTKILCGSRNTSLLSQGALEGGLSPFISKWLQILTFSGITEQEEDAQKCVKVLQVLKGDHFSTNSPANSQGMPGGTASSSF